MHPHSFVWHYLWLAPALIQIAIVGMLVRRKRLHDYPWFLAYSAWSAIGTLALFSLDHSPLVSANIYWECSGANDVISTVLRFGVISELFRHIFDQYRALKPLSRSLLRWGTAILFLVAVAISAYSPTKDVPLFSPLLSAGRAVAIVQSGLLLMLFAVSFYFRIPWKSFTFGVAAGMAIYAAVNLAMLAIRVATGPVETHWMSLTVMAAYNCSTMVWLSYALLPESESTPPNSLPEHNLEEWNKELQRFLTP